MVDDDQHVLEIIGEKTKRLRLLQVQEARKGHDTPPEILIEIEELGRQIAGLRNEADSAVSGMGVPMGLLSNATASIRSVGPRQSSAPMSAVRALPDHLLFCPTERVMGPAVPALVLDPPVLSPRISLRARTVSDLVGLMGGKTWGALYGASSTGKTFLLRLIAGGDKENVSWLGLKGLDESAACGRLEQACATLAGSLPPPQRGWWYRKVCEAIGPEGILVLDDMPDLAKASDLRDRLVPLVAACGRAGVRVISAGSNPLPASLRAELDGTVVELAVPPLTDEEAGDLLRLYGADEHFIGKNATLINEVVRRHPFLLVAASRYFQVRGWAIGDAEIADLFSGKHADDLAGEVYYKLRATVPDGLTRDLLYRLALAGQVFGASQLQTLADVPHKLDRAAERLRDVTHSWVEPLPAGKWRPSPLLARLAEEHLDSDTMKGCHRALGGLILSGGRIDPAGGLAAILHLHKGDDWDKAAELLIQFLAAAWSSHRSWADEPVLRMWADHPLPPGMDLGSRALIRGMQIAISARSGKQAAFLAGDLDSLLSDVNASHMAGVGGAVAYALMGAGAILPTESNRWLRKYYSLSAAGRARGSRSKRPARAGSGLRDLPQEFPGHELIWLVVGGLRTSEQINDWLDTVACMPGGERSRSFRTDRGHLGSVVVGDRLALAELSLSEDARDWPAALARLDALAERARRLSLEGLWAAFMRSKINAQGEYFRDLDGAQNTATSALQAASSDPSIRFLIAGSMGRQHVFAGRYGDARFWLGLALRCDSDQVFTHERVRVLLAASHAFGVEDGREGVRLAQTAVDLAERGRDVPQDARARAYCELAVAIFLVDGANAAFGSWDRAAEGLYESRGEDDEWRDLAVIFGHTTGYLARLAATGEPPLQTRDGEAYTPPQRGVFLTLNRGRLEYFDGRAEGGLWRMVGWYADAVGSHGRGEVWKGRALEIAKARTFTPLLLESVAEDFPELVRERGVAGALTEARRAGYVSVVIRREAESGNLAHLTDTELPPLAARLDDAGRRAAEGLAGVLGLIPAVLLVARRSIAADSEEARRAGMELSACCRAIAAESGDPGLWLRLAEGVDLGYTERRSFEDVSAWAGTIPAPLPESVAVLCRLAATANCTPEQGVVSLLAIMPVLCAWYPSRSSTHRELLLPFVQNYLTDAIKNRRFLFSSPNVIDALLPAALAAPEENRVVELFRAFRAGIRFSGPLPAEINSWLADHANSDFGVRSSPAESSPG